MIRWLITRVIAFVIPLRFDRVQAGGVDATFELRIGIRGRVSRFTIAIADSRCAVRAAPAPSPDACASVSLANLIRLVLGDVAWPQLLARGQFELTGDPFLALRLPTMFGMTARRMRSWAFIRDRLPAGDPGTIPR